MKKEDFYSAPIKGKGSPVWWVAALLKAIFYPVFGIAFRPKVIGRENLPKDTAFIVSGNHTSYLDPVFLWYRLKIKVRCMAKAELSEIPFVGGLAARVYAFPVHRGSADRAAIRNATGALRRGENLCIFPEGKRVHAGMDVEFHNGASFLATLNKVPVVPVGLEGPSRIWPPGQKLIHFPKVVIRVGKPVYYEDFADLPKGERQDAMTAEIMRRVYALRDNKEY